MTESPDITHNLKRLNEALKLYVRANLRSMGVCIAWQADKLGRNLSKEAKGLMPPKGAITAERLQAFKAGEGIAIRPSVMKWIAEKYQPVSSVALHATLMAIRSGAKQRGKKIIALATMVRDPETGHMMNLQALAAKRELAVRESGRGFTSHALRLGVQSVRDPASIAGDGVYETKTVQSAVSRYGPTLGQYALRIDAKNGTATFKWGGYSKLSDEAVKAMGRARGQAKIAMAIKETTDDIIPYLELKLGEGAVASFK